LATTKPFAKLDGSSILIGKRKVFALAAALGAFTFNVGAWDYEEHRAIHELALVSLPAGSGGFTLTSALKQRIASSEASRTAGTTWAICH
jgi:hypothetical protein